MGKNVVILNGSPRANGNTAALLEAFAEGAVDAGNSVLPFFLQRLKIASCLGCYGGGKDPASPCVQKDDMDEIYPAYKKADYVVLASPLYFWNISGQLKCAFDRLFAVTEESPDLATPPKKAMLIMAAQGDGFEETVFWYNGIMKHLGWTDCGQVLASGVEKPGDVKGTPFIEQARKLGASIK